MTARRLALVIEDDVDARALLTRALTGEGFAVSECDTLETAREILGNRAVDVVLLDLGLPDENGLKLLSDLRESREVPVIIVSGSAEIEDRVIGLRLGADDYITKPFSTVELAARVDAVLRRAVRRSQDENLIYSDGLRIDLAAREVTRNGKHIELRPREFDMLCELATHPRRVFSREELLRRVWRSSSEWQTPATVTEHARRLRAALEGDAGSRRHIVTLRGVGYRFDP